MINYAFVSTKETTPSSFQEKKNTSIEKNHQLSLSPISTHPIEKKKRERIEQRLV